MTKKKGSITLEFALCLIILFIILCSFLDFLFWDIKGFYLNTYTSSLTRELSIQGGVMEGNTTYTNDYANKSKIDNKLKSLCKALACDEIILTIEQKGVKINEQENYDSDDTINKKKITNTTYTATCDGSNVTWSTAPSNDNLIAYGGNISVVYEAKGANFVDAIGLTFKNSNRYTTTSLRRSSNY